MKYIVVESFFVIFILKQMDTSRLLHHICVTL